MALLGSVRQGKDETGTEWGPMADGNTLVCFLLGKRI